MAVHVEGEVVAIRKVGAYHHLSFTAVGVPELTRPGHFVALSVGGDTSANLLRRAFSIHRVNERGLYGGTVEIVFAAHGPGTRWLASLERGAQLNVVGPLGKPFALPAHPVGCVLVGGGYGAAPLAMLAEQLQKRGCRVDVILGAASADRLYGVLDARRSASSVTVTTDDGSSGIHGRVTDALPDILERTGADVVYACGPMGMLSAISALCEPLGVHTQCAVEESMACGVGVCMTCVLPVIGDDGVTRMVRSCVEGPVFRGERVRWGDVGHMPADVLGAPQAVN